MTGLIGAVADLVSTVIVLFYYAALITGAFVLLLWALAMLGMWLAHRAERKKHDAQLGDDVTAMLSAWKDKPEIIPDALSAELARMMREGGEQHG